MMERVKLAEAKTTKEWRRERLRRLAQETIEMLERQEAERAAALAEALHPGGRARS
jgi:hypothetical protein